jgi:hypothetical protein
MKMLGVTQLATFERESSPIDYLAFPASNNLENIGQLKRWYSNLKDPTA